jgi:hypothetical protein
LGLFHFPAKLNPLSDLCKRWIPTIMVIFDHITALPIKNRLKYHAISNRGAFKPAARVK